MLPPTHHTIRVSTSTDVSKQFISSDRATAVSLPCPQGDQELVTWDLATQHPLLWALAPSRDPPQGSGQAQRDHQVPTSQMLSVDPLHAWHVPTAAAGPGP